MKIETQRSRSVNSLRMGAIGKRRRPSNAANERGRCQPRRAAFNLDATDLRTSYQAYVRELVDELRPKLESGYYREWRDLDCDRFTGAEFKLLTGKLVKGTVDDLAPRFRLEYRCRRLIGSEENGRLVVGLSPNAGRVYDHDFGATEKTLMNVAEEALALDILAEAKRQGIRAPSERAAIAAWRSERELARAQSRSVAS